MWQRRVRTKDAHEAPRSFALLDLGRCVAARGVRAKSDETCFGFLGLNDALAQSQISHCTNSMPFKAALLRSNIRAQTLGRLRLFPELG